MVEKNRNLVLGLIDSHLSQRGLAQRARVHESRLSLMVNGRLIPSKDEATRIAEVLGKKTSDLFQEVA